MNKNEKRGRVIAFGDVNVDLVVDLPEKNAVRPEAILFSGGTVGNTAAGLARLGLDVSFLGKVGGDGFGKFIRDEFISEGVDTSFLLEDKEDFTLMVIAFIDSHGERHNTAWPPRGTAQFNLDISNFPDSIWKNTCWFHSSGIILGEKPSQDTTIEMMREARRRKIPVSFDLNLRLEYFGWRSGVRDAVLKAVELSDYVFASLNEELFPLTRKNESRSAVENLMHDGLTIIARQGNNDTIVFFEDEMKSFKPYSVQIVDTLGAGDAFNSGFIYGIQSGYDIDRTIRTAHACAGYNIMHSGARSLPNKQELDSFIQKY